MKLALIDIDGVIANIDLRMQKAKDAKEAFLEECRKNPVVVPDKQDRAKQAIDLFWQTAFGPTNVPMDTLIEGVNDALEVIASAGYVLVFLTSRPVAMEEATRSWFDEHVALMRASVFVFKYPAFQYTKTITWKAGMAQTLVSLYGADDVLIIDDEQANIEEHLKFVDANVQTRVFYHSLKETVEALQAQS